MTYHPGKGGRWDVRDTANTCERDQGLPENFVEESIIAHFPDDTTVKYLLADVFGYRTNRGVSSKIWWLLYKLLKEVRGKDQRIEQLEAELREARRAETTPA